MGARGSDRWVRLLEDDPLDTVRWNKAGQIGHWSASSVIPEGPYEHPTTRELLFKRRVVDLLGWCGGMAFLAGKRRKAAREAAFLEVEAAVKELLQRVFDETRCNDCCKGLYFCDLPRGHEGAHREGGLAW